MAWIRVCDTAPNASGVCSTGWRNSHTDDFRDFANLTISDAGQIATAIILLWVVAYVGRLIRRILENRNI
ncbi:hypothetical protein E6Q11_05060 [Candidatus Dojkabacteria bacterium]|uniref:Uncharacterized protein n=1 Tax=Candidatus Dojkabacteria bacterium TaxID=2099670 RepID=A0A5C7J490_9BACT|nr:MAG: hypothetical protein E6Q11_05060 [Candidatus Dojkabacteria bacterium]